MLCEKLTRQYLGTINSMENWFYNFVNEILREKGLIKEIYISYLQILSESLTSTGSVFSCYFKCANDLYWEEFSIYYDEAELKERLIKFFDDVLKTNK